MRREKKLRAQLFAIAWESQSHRIPNSHSEEKSEKSQIKFNEIEIIVQARMYVKRSMNMLFAHRSFPFFNKLKTFHFPAVDAAAVDAR